MRAIVVNEYGGPDVLVVEDIGVPAPEADEVLVKVEAAGVNPVDTYIREGQHATTPPLPFTPGKDGAGLVEDFGADVRGVSKGDRVYIAGSVTGTYAEYCICRADQVHKLPENVSFEKGAGVFVPYATAYRALFQKASVSGSDRVLIHGASGAVGLAAVQWAKNAGAFVIGTAGSEKGRELVAENGADIVLDHSGDDEFGHLQDIWDEYEGVDVILEMLANKNLAEDFQALKMYGRIVVIGNRGSLDFNPRLTMGKDATILGMSLFNAPDEKMAEIHEAIGKGLEDSVLDPVIGGRFSLEDAPRAHREVINSKAYGKIVILPGG